MTNAHERITLPPISSFDISPSRKNHNQYPSRRGSRLNGSPSWDGSSAGSNKPRTDVELVDDVRRNSSTFDALESSHRERGVVTGLRVNHSPHSEPVAITDTYESTPSAPRPRSSSAALDRRGSLIPQRRMGINVSPHTSPRENPRPSPGPLFPALRQTVHMRALRDRVEQWRRHKAQPHQFRVPGNSTRNVPDAKANATWSETQGVRDARGGIPGFGGRAISPEPSESEAKKKYKKKMNVRHYRAQNKDAMTQLRDALPEHMRPPERQAKAYVTLSAIKYIRELTAENERLRAENVRQAKELMDRHNDPNTGDVGVVGDDDNDDDDDELEDDAAPKAEVPSDEGK
ncbi:hypothetical protein BGW80DRAFT_1462039 [Lactifluus volemus]|nr:hypothetical protein BGW80DRAFT_1462039 [Lactifluus volemus]